MPLHRSESNTQKTLNFTGVDTFVKEKYMLSRERVTAFTQVCSDPRVQFQPEFVFKGKGTRGHLNPPPGVNVQWAPKGSYRLEHMIHTIGNLPNRHSLFTLKNYDIYILDDYSVHLLPDIRQALLKKGYVLVGIGGGITGDVQINETDMHAPLKSKYRELEAELMIEQLQSNPNKIPQPSKDDMMRMLDIAWKSVLGRVDVEDRFKALWVTNNFDGSEDFLVSQKIMDLVGTELIEYRKRLMEKESPKTPKQLMSKIRPPKGVRRKGEGNKPWDEGIEMFDCEGDVIEDEEEGNDVEEEVENEEEENSHNAQMSNVS